MNPQQFQNMGMGRAVPMQMNPAFNINQHMGGQMGGQQMQMQGMPQQANLGHPQLQKHIFTTLQSQGPFSGWQATVNVNERAAQVKLLVDSLRLVRPPVELPRALEVALQFERKCFSQSTSKEEYYKECSEKLGKIRDQRAQQMSQAATNNMQGMQGVQQNFPVMGQNMNNMGQQNMQMNMPQNMQQIQNQQMMQRNIHMQNQPQMVQNQQFQGQQNPQQNAQPKQNQAEQLSPDENKAINLRAAELAKSTPKEKMRQIVEGMAPQLRANLQQRGVDPIIYYFRMMATKEFRRQRAVDGGMTGNQTQPDQMQAQNQGMPQNPNGFMNEMGSRLQDLQAEARRSQEIGEMVVPASNNNSMIPDQVRLSQQMLANARQMNQQPQGTMDPNLLEQQRRLQQQQAKMQQAARFRAQAQGDAQAQTMGQNQIQNAPQAGTPLAAINRPVNVTQGVSPQLGSRPPSRTPVMGQQTPMQPAQRAMNMQEAQQREQVLAQYPVQIQNILRQKPTSEWKATIQTIRANPALQQNAAMQRSLSHQGMPRQQPSQQQPPQIQNGAFLGGSNIGTPMQQSLSAGATQGNQQPSMPPNQNQINPEIVRQRQAAMNQQQQLQQQRMQAGQAGGQPQSQPQGQQIPRPLNPPQMNFMDNQPVPPNVLTGIRSQGIELPMEVKSWINLKQWAMNNPIPNVPIQRLMQYQSSHFAFMMRARQQQQQQQQATPQQGMPPSQMQNMPGQQQPQAFAQQQLARPSDQDIQRLRAQNPRLQNMTDDQVRNAIIERQRQQLQQAMQQQTGQPVGAQPGQIQQPPQQKPQIQQPPQKVQPQQPVRPPSQAAQPKQQPATADKGVKRPNETQKADAAPAPTGPPRIPQLTREQFNTLPNDKKGEYMDRQHMIRLMGMGKSVQATAPPLQPIKLDAAARQKIIANLTKDTTKNMMNRYDQFLLAVWKMRQDEAEIRGLVLNKLHLFSQYDPPSIQTKSWVPKQALSMTPERVEEILTDLSARFKNMTAGIPKQAQPSQLTSENLSQLQKEEDRKKTIKGKDVPPAPTTTAPPFQFGDRGQGTPKYGGSGLKQEDLKLDPKRRKKNPPAGQTPASQVSATPSAASPQVTKAQPPAPTFKCPILNCEHNKQGFSTQTELEQHTNTVHTEPITDPLAFLDASLRDAFNLDENFKQIKRPLPPKAANMEKTASKGNVANLKAEAATPSAMAKPPSRPQSAHFNKDVMGLKAQADDWEHSKISLEELNNIFGDMDWEEAVPAAALELQDRFIEQYQKSEEWQKLIRKPTGVLTDTETDKSTSPPNAANKEPEVKSEGDKKEDLFVDLEIEGLDLTGLDDFGENIGEDTAMANEDGSSPFEILDKPDITAEQQFLLDNGIDYTRPEAMDPGQKKLMDFIMEPLVVGKELFDSAPWEEIDWEAEKKQREEDIRLGTPGAWNGKGFNRFP